MAHHILAAALFLFAAHRVSQCSSDGRSPTVETEYGKVLGHLMTSRKGREFFAFQKIPYAAPPVGELRFKDPQSPPKFDGILDATKDGDDCMQVDAIFNSYEYDDEGFKAGRIVGSEDCLYLNVYSPEVRTDKLLPVMFSIHGGGLVVGSGSSHLFGPHLFLDKDIVLVTINYRLGALGFLSLESDDLKGNMGLKDQLAALEWVKKNIKSFGGDPKSITVFGESAGAMSTHLLMSSSRAQGLFERGISQSGDRLAPWAVAPRGLMRKRTVELGQGLNCPAEPPQALLSCLRQQSAQTLMKAASELFPRLLSFAFRPVIEGKGNDSYLTLEDYQRKTTRPWLTGVTSAEGLMFLDQYCMAGDTELTSLNKHYKSILPSDIFYDFKTTKVDEMTESIKKYYLGDKQFSMDDLNKIIDLYTDGAFIYPHYKAVQNHIGKLYTYFYTHKGERSFSSVYGCPNDKGANHGDDILQMFYAKKLYPDMEYNEEDGKIVEMLLDFWTNFATYENPTPPGHKVNWEERGDENKFLHIGSDRVEMDKDLFIERMQFWDELTEKYILSSASKDEL